MSGLQAALHSASRPATERDEPTAIGTERVPLSLLEPDTRLQGQENREPYLPAADRDAAEDSLTASQIETPGALASPSQAAAADGISPVDSKPPLAAEAKEPGQRRRIGRGWFIAAALVALGGTVTPLLLRDARIVDPTPHRTPSIASASPAVPSALATARSSVATHADAGMADEAAAAGTVIASQAMEASNDASTGDARPNAQNAVDRSQRAGPKTKMRAPRVAAQRPPAGRRAAGPHTEPSVSNPFVTVAPRPPLDQPPAQAEVSTARETTIAVDAVTQRGRTPSGAGTSAGARRSDAGDADAIVGSAARAAAVGRRGEARERFEQALKVDPHHSGAAAGLLTLVARDNPYRAEQTLLQAIARSPAPALYFALGNVYAAQADWRRARVAYEHALTLMPVNADYAYNLAIAHDHLAQHGPALLNYRAALASTRDAGNPGFDVQRVRRRVEKLEHRVDER